MVAILFTNLYRLVPPGVSGTASEPPTCRTAVSGFMFAKLTRYRVPQVLIGYIHTHKTVQLIHQYLFYKINYIKSQSQLKHTIWFESSMCNFHLLGLGHILFKRHLSET